MRRIKADTSNKTKKLIKERKKNKQKENKSTHFSMLQLVL